MAHIHRIRERQQRWSSLTLIEKTLFRSWWVLLFFLLCYMGYEQSVIQTNRRIAEFQSKLDSLKKEKQHAEALFEDYQRQINSQSDPAWIELTLMKGLGMVPEGYQKVYFKEEQQ